MERSTSMFYYWNKCPLEAVYYYKYKNKQLFPKYPDTDLGNIIHSFYKNKYKWNITDKNTFNKKWRELTDELNNAYKGNTLQLQYIPVQWHSNYYAVKKQLLKNSLIKQKNPKLSASKVKNEVWIEDKKKY